METKLKFMELSQDTLKKLLESKNVNYKIDENFRKNLGNKALYKTLDIKYAIIYNFDSVQFGTIDEIIIDLNNIIEARFFNENMEIDIRIDEDNLEGSILIDEGEKELIIEENFFISGSKYKRLRAKKYIELDEDNQGHIFYLKPCELLKEA